MKNEFRKYFSIFLTGAACILFYFIMERFHGLYSAAGAVIHIIRPFIFGAVIAYLLTPLSTKMEELICRAAGIGKKPKKKQEKQKAAIEYLCILASIIIFIFVVYGLLSLIVPQLVISIKSLIMSTPDYLNKVSDWLEEQSKDTPLLQEYISVYTDNLNEKLQEMITSNLLPHLDTIVSRATSGLMSALSAFKDLIIGLIIAVYIMSNRKNFRRQIRMLLLAIFPYKYGENVAHDEQFADWLTREIMILNEYTGNFVKGKLIDSLIIGIICLIFTVAVRMPYALLISIVVGVTNIIPFFGPFIGAIPSALLILMVDPVQCIVFVIFILILQQVDGNIIGPKILGNATNLNSFWILFAILLFGGLFGIPGMIIGVPIFGFIYQLVREIVSKRNKKMKAALKSYYQLDDELEALRADAAAFKAEEEAAKAAEAAAKSGTETDK